MSNNTTLKEFNKIKKRIYRHGEDTVMKRGRKRKSTIEKKKNRAEYYQLNKVRIEFLKKNPVGSNSGRKPKQVVLTC